MQRRRLGAALTALALLFTVVVGIAGASDLTPGPLVQVSGTSPFVGCTADEIGPQSGTVYLNSEVEPWIDVNPTNPSNVVGIWQQDRWSNGGSRGLVAGASIERRRELRRPCTIPKLTRLLGRHRGERRRLPAGYRPVGLVRPERQPSTSSACRSTTSVRRSRRRTSTTPCWPAGRLTAA